jgi:hypothetical protein
MAEGRSVLRRILDRLFRRRCAHDLDAMTAAYVEAWRREMSTMGSPDAATHWNASALAATRRCLAEALRATERA